MEKENKAKMTFKKKAAVLSALIVILLAVYILSLAFDPANRRDTSFAWLESAHVNMVDRIEIYGAEGWIILNRLNNVWFLNRNNRDLPAMQERVADLFTLLSRKNVTQVRSSSSEAMERFRLTETNAFRIIVRGGAGLPLLDLLVGAVDSLGREIYLRKGDSNQIFSAEDGYSQFVEYSPAAWSDLRLFLPQTESGVQNPAFLLTTDMVQQVEIAHPERDKVIFRRSGSGWIIPENENLNLDAVMVDAWLRLLLEAKADDFELNDLSFVDGSITLYLGDGSTKTLQVGSPETYAEETIDGQRSEKIIRRAKVSGQPYVYSLSERTFYSLFRDFSFYIKE